MATIFERQLVAGHQFLKGLRRLPSYSDARQKQLESILRHLSAVPEVPTVQAAKIFSLLDEDVWDEDSLRVLREHVAEKTMDGTEASQGRRATQDFTDMPRFLPDSVWQVLLNEKVSGQEGLEVLCHHAANLGLRLPSEATIAMLLTLSYQGQALAMSSNAKFNLSVRQRPLIRKILQAKSRPAVWLTALPEAWTDLPATCRELAFPEGAQPAPTPIGSLDFGAMAKAWPMRNTNRLLCGDESAGSGSTSTCADTTASMDKLVEAVASTAKLAYAAAVMHQVPEPQRVHTQASVAQAQQTPLALEDLPREETPAQAVADTPIV